MLLKSYPSCGIQRLGDHEDDIENKKSKAGQQDHKNDAYRRGLCQELVNNHKPFYLVNRP